jgi:hypothetical protein
MVKRNAFAVLTGWTDCRRQMRKYDSCTISSTSRTVGKEVRK